MMATMLFNTGPIWENQFAPDFFPPQATSTTRVLDIQYLTPLLQTCEPENVTFLLTTCWCQQTLFANWLWSVF